MDERIEGFISECDTLSMELTSLDIISVLYSLCIIGFSVSFDFQRYDFLKHSESLTENYNFLQYVKDRSHI